MTYMLNTQWLKKVEDIVDRMAHPDTGIPIKNVQGLVTKIYGVVTGSDIVAWIAQNFRGLHDNIEAHHIAHMLACHGYLFPVDNHYFTIRSDGSLYRIQSRRYWLSQQPDPDNSDYAVYLAKRSMQSKPSLELDVYEADMLVQLKKMFAAKWSWISMQAESQLKIDKKKDKVEKKIYDSQERAFWDLHRPAPGVVNSVEADIRSIIKPANQKKPGPYHVKGCPEVKDSTDPEHTLSEAVAFLKRLNDRNRTKLSKVGEMLTHHSEVYAEFDPFLQTPEGGNPWLSEQQQYEWFETEHSRTHVPKRRYKRWAISFNDLLRDEAGREEFRKFLEKEVSAENLDFWWAIKELKTCPHKAVKTKIAEIYVDYMVDGAQKGINVDSRVADVVRQNVVSQPNRYSFAAAEEHIYTLMKNDSYYRYLRSDDYKEFVNNMKKSKRSPSIGTKLNLFGHSSKLV